MSASNDPDSSAALIPDLRRLDPFGFTIRGYRPGCRLKVALTPRFAEDGAGAGRKPIDQDAYLALETIRRGRRSGRADLEPWIQAFKMVGWLVDGMDGPVLTVEGLRGHDDLLRRKRHGSRLRMHDDVVRLKHGDDASPRGCRSVDAPAVGPPC
jgi:hypothetical protein